MSLGRFKRHWRWPFLRLSTCCSWCGDWCESGGYWHRLWFWCGFGLCHVELEGLEVAFLADWSGHGAQRAGKTRKRKVKMGLLCKDISMTSPTVGVDGQVGERFATVALTSLDGRHFPASFQLRHPLSPRCPMGALEYCSLFPVKAWAQYCWLLSTQHSTLGVTLNRSLSTYSLPCS